MNTLFISSLYLFRETRFGGSKRLYYFAKELENYGDVHVICYDACGELVNSTIDPSQNRDFDHFLFLPAEDTRSFIEKIFRSSIINEGFLRANSGLFKDFFGRAAFDAAFLAFPLSLSAIGTVIPPATNPIVYLEDDLLVEKIRTEKKTLFLDPYRSIRLKQLRSYYKKKLSRVDTFISISPQEQEIVRRHFPFVRSQIVKYGVPLEEFPVLESAPADFTAGFIGNFRHVPNADALAWFLREVHPALKTVIPEIKVLVGGTDIPAALSNGFPADGSIVWAGEVSVLSDFYKRISVLVNPIVSGRGMRTKLIEAAAFGRPIISTSLGAEGLEDLSIDVANSAKEFAECCGRLRSDGAYYLDNARKNRKKIEQSYSIEAVGRQLVDILQTPRRIR